MAESRMITSVRWNSRSLILLFIGVSVLTGARTILAKQGQDEKDSSSRLLRSMAKVHMAFGDYSKAQPLVEQAMRLAQANHASDAELALCLIDAAWLYKNQYKLGKAEEICLAGLKLQEQAHGTDHPHVAYTLRILSSIYQEQGRFAQAVSTLDRATAIAEKHSSPGSASLAAFEVDFGSLMHAMGEFARAEAYYSKALPVIVESCGPDHLYTAQVLGKIAALYTAQGKYAQAETLIAKTLTIQEKVYGPDHSLMAPAWLTMAAIYVSKGSYPQAQELCQKALRALEPLFDQDHPTIVKAREIMDIAIRKSAGAKETPSLN